MKINAMEAKNFLKDKPSSKTHEVALQFEAIMTSEMIKSMTKTVSLGEGGFASDFVQSMFEETCTKAISEKGGLGLAETIFKQMESMR